MGLVLVADGLRTTTKAFVDAAKKTAKNLADFTKTSGPGPLMAGATGIGQIAVAGGEAAIAGTSSLIDPAIAGICNEPMQMSDDYGDPAKDIETAFKDLRDGEIASLRTYITSEYLLLNISEKMPFRELIDRVGLHQVLEYKWELFKLCGDEFRTFILDLEEQHTSMLL